MKIKNHLNMALRVEHRQFHPPEILLLFYIFYSAILPLLLFTAASEPRLPVAQNGLVGPSPENPLFLSFSSFFLSLSFLLLFSLFSPPSSSSSLYLPLIDHPRSSLYSQCSLLVRPSTSSRSGLSPLPPARCVLLCCSQLPRYTIHSQCNRELC